MGGDGLANVVDPGRDRQLRRVADLGHAGASCLDTHFGVRNGPGDGHQIVVATRGHQPPPEPVLVALHETGDARAQLRRRELDSLLPGIGQEAVGHLLKFMASDHLEVFRIGSDASPGGEAGQDAHLLIVELEIEDLQILFDPRRRHRLRDRDHAVLHVPAQHHLSG